jgi:hypothetical protein
MCTFVGSSLEMAPQHLQLLKIAHVYYFHDCSTETVAILIIVSFNSVSSELQSTALADYNICERTHPNTIIIQACLRLVSPQ